MAGPGGSGGGRYGGGSEGFEDTLRRFQQQKSLRDELIRKNAELAQSEEQGAAAGEDAAAVRNRIAAETEAVARREAAANELESVARTRDTSAIDANITARQRNIATMNEEEGLYKRHQALQQGLYETQTRYRQTIARQGVGSEDAQALAAREAQIRQRMASIEQQIQYAGGAPPPRVPRGVQEEDQYGPRLLGPGRTTISSGGTPATTERTQAAAAATGQESAIRSLNAEIKANVAAQQAAAVTAREEAAAEQEAGAAAKVHGSQVQGSVAIERERAVATRESAAAFSALDTSMYRHGALTSEFIAAAARGEVTLRDLGNQVLLTTGKFAGWTAAAGLVYGAYEAIKQLGSGAVETNNAVNNMQRFINNLNVDRAKDQLRSIATEANVPIKDVAEAANQFARVFHNQDQAFEAARASVILTKLDNISAADSYKSLTAAVQGFHLQASDIPKLMDSINASQRQFGANVSQIVPGFGRAAGAYDVAGGTPQYLQALLATIIRTTGGSGTQAATAIARSATRFTQTPKNIETLASYGINAQVGDYDKVIDQVFNAIKSRNLGRQDINKIAQALGGPQLGSRSFEGLLTNPDLFYKILRDTSPEKAKGTATEELKIKLHSFSEELKSVGVSLQTFGSELAQTGIFTPIELAVRAMAELAHIAGDALGAFNEIPAPLRDALVIITAIVAATRLMQRFGGPGTLLSRVPGLGGLGSSDQVFQRRLVSGLRTQRGEAYNFAEGAARRGVGANIEAEAAANRVTAFQQANAAALTGQVGLRAQVEAEEEVARLEQLRANAIDRANAANAQVLAANKIAQRTDAEIAEVRSLSAAEARTFAAQRGIGAPRSFNRPDSSGLEYAGSPAGYQRTRSGLFVPGQEGGAPREAEAEVARREVTAASSSVRAVRDKLSGTMTILGNEINILGQTGGLLGRGAAGVAGKVDQGLTALTGARGAIGALPGRIAGMWNSFAQSFGLLDAAFIAFAAYEVIKPLADKAQADAQHAVDIQNQAAQQSLDALHKANRRPVQRASTGREITAFLTGGPGAESKYLDTIDAANQAQAGNQELEAQIIQQQARARRRGTPIPNQTYQQILASAQQEFQDYQAGRLSLKQLNDDLAKHAVETRATIFSGKDGGQEARQQLNQLAAQAADPNRSSYYTYLETLDQKHLQALTTSTERDLKAFGTGTQPGQSAMRALAIQLGRYEDIALNSGNQGDIDAFAQAQETITSAIKTQVDNDLKVSLSIATNEQQRQQAYAEAIRSTAGIIHGPNIAVQKYSANLANDQKGLADARAKYAQATQPGVFSPNGVSAEGERAAIHKYLDQIKTDRDQLKKAQQYRAEAMREYNAAVEQLKEQQAQDYAAGVDARVALQNSTNQDKAFQIHNQVRGAGAKVAEDIKLFGRNNRITEQAIAEYNNLQAQAAQQSLSDIQARGTVALSNINASVDPVGKARQTLANAQQSLSYIQGHRSQFDFSAYEQAVAAVNDARNSLADAITQQATGLINAQGQLAQARDAKNPIASAQDQVRTASQLLQLARTPTEQVSAMAQLTTAQTALDKAIADNVQARFTYLESLTTDPLRADRLAIQAAQAGVQGTQGADRYRALATLNKAKQQYIADRVSTRESDVQFQLDMGQISTDQAIADLEALLKIHNLSKQQRQEIQKRIHDLQTQGASSGANQFDLNVGQIKLPTAYDVRRAIAGVRDAIPGGTQHNFKTNVTVQIYADGKSGEQAAIRGVERALNTSVRAHMRAAGVR